MEMSPFQKHTCTIILLTIVKKKKPFLATLDVHPIIFLKKELLDIG